MPECNTNSDDRFDYQWDRLRDDLAGISDNKARYGLSRADQDTWVELGYYDGDHDRRKHVIDTHRAELAERYKHILSFDPPKLPPFDNDGFERRMRERMKESNERINAVIAKLPKKRSLLERVLSMFVA